MISCTEFIPAYSELFTFLDRKYGPEEVNRLWDDLFAPDGKGIPLINFARKDGLKGCIDYWNGTLSEEAAEVTRMYNLEEGWIRSTMHHCPSKGRLLELKKSIGLEPYPRYCEHCDYYRKALEEVGLTWIRNHVDVDEARCSSMIWDPKIFKGVMHRDENTVTVEIHAAEHTYFHPGFHSSMNRGIDYVGRTHGEDDVRAYLQMYTEDVYKPVFAEAKTDPLGAIEKKIRETYELEQASDALTVENDGKTLSVKIAYCPAVKYLQSIGTEVSEWFPLSTEVVMQTLAEKAGLKFTMESYDEKTGAAAYSFTK